VTGPLDQPVLELISRPQLETSEIQSYLLTGRSPRSRDSVLGIGTYVTRKIYVGYGFNMLERTSEFNSLFNISPRYGVGSSVGEADNNINMTITYEH
jgi:autotransporter translocation and assembly factor TamB